MLKCLRNNIAAYCNDEKLKSLRQIASLLHKMKSMRTFSLDFNMIWIDISIKVLLGYSNIYNTN